jgi:hypothetical protein
MSSALRAPALAVAIATVVVAWGCDSFDEGDVAPDDAGFVPDGGRDAGSSGTVDGAPVDAAPRDVTITPGWPDDGTLDPAKDPRLDSIRVTITDAADAARTAKIDAKSSELGPYTFSKFASSPLVDVVIELFAGDGRLLGYGEARRVDIASATTITVTVRKRLLYAALGDGVNQRVVAYDLAPQTAEPSFAVPAIEVVTMPYAGAVAVSPDGKFLSIAHKPAGGGGGVAVYSTSNHQSQYVVAIPFAPWRMVPVGAGPDVLVLPGSSSNTAALARVNVVTREVKAVKSGFLGGSIVVEGAVVTADGRKAYLAANHLASPFGVSKAYLCEIDLVANDAKDPVVITEMSTVSSLRFSHDEDELFVVGTAVSGGGIVMTFDLNRATPTTQAGPLGTNAISIFVHPEGRRVFVSTDGPFHVYNEVWSQVSMHPIDGGPVYQLASAVRLPYAPFRVLAGQTNAGNDTNGSIVELTADGDAPASVLPVTDVNGTLFSLATPFGKQR